MFGGELFVPAATRLSLALAGGLSLIVIAERRHLRELTSRVLFLRWRTWALSAPLFGAAAMGPVAFAVAFVMALSFQGMREYAALVGLDRRYARCLYGVGVLSIPLAIVSLTAWRATPPLLLIAATLPPLLSRDLGHAVKQTALAAFGFAYIPWLLTYLLLIRENVTNGAQVLLVLGMSIALSDVCAFAIGKLFGRHALAPRLSPNKTVEGTAGNIIGAYLGLAIMSFGIPEDLNRIVVASLPLVVALGSLWGDLVESLIKRRCHAKDAGTLLPGFGGLLDRIDSMLLVLPLAYTVLVLWG